MIIANYTELRSNLKDYLDRVVKDSDNIIVTRRNGAAVVIVSLDEYESMVETACGSYAPEAPSL